MKFYTHTITVIFGLAITICSLSTSAQSERDYVFTDNEGHLILRFVGIGSDGLSENQLEEVINVQLSTMVHHRLRADAVFEAQPFTQWSDIIEPQIKKHIKVTGPEFSITSIECRANACRLILGHDEGWNVSEHQSIMASAQLIMTAFIASNSENFDQIFLIAAHYQEPDIPYLKLFLQKTRDQN